MNLAVQGVDINRRHPWLADVTAAPLVGPNGLRLTEYVLALLEDHPASDSQKLVAYAVMIALVTAFASSQYGAADPSRAHGTAAYLAHLLAQGHHPHLAAHVTGSDHPDELFPDVMRGVLRGLLEPSRGPGDD